MLMTAEERVRVETLSALARCNPFLPERKEHERATLGDAFEDVSPVWSKHLDRENPNVVKIAARAEPLARSLKKRQSDGQKPTEEEHRLIEEVVFYLLYGRFEQAFERAMAQPDVTFYDDFVKAARDYLPSVSERALPHWFAFLFQVRRASYHIFDFVVGKSLPAARLRGAIWQSIFTHDLRRYRRALFDKMGDVTTLITGPSGTGKEIVAQAIGLSRFIPFEPRQKRFELEAGDSFFALNLSALAPTIIESELFGHRRGAFTGALTDRKGWLALCPARGTVFLDEIGEVDPAIQVKLLRVLQTREFQPIGDTKTQTFAGKIVAATNRDLATEMQSGRFREDLYYRLCSDLITTPSLREQLRDTPDDLHDLVRFIARRVVGKEESETVTKEVLEWIGSHLERDYAWPGNVRELEQCVRNIVIRKAYRPAAIGGETGSVVDLDRSELSAEELLAQYCAVVYARNGSYVETARKLGLDRRTVKSKVEAFHRRRPSTTD
ncbi:MAG: sigma-54-dependent Fis family transcriptional regulator [Acidobacteria bacterium]|nr:MAG: sigma-54-dependent Fis family transcriptional regulator [Acidobacteriota bacterium]